MSTQASPLPKSPELPKLPKIENQNPDQPQSLLDGPWKVRIYAEEPPVPTLPPGVWPSPSNEAQVRKSLPWRAGDVARLKDDTPEGMMRYIATHATGWWQEMAERALRDTEKAERMAREAGWQYGQYWALEMDAEAKQKLLDAEEAKRQREEAERAREAAEKEAFIKRQTELLEKAGRAPRCEYEYADGRRCRAPQVKGERWCHGHAKTMSYRPEKLDILPMEDDRAVMVNLYRVTKSLLAGAISEKRAGLMLWSVAMGMPGARRLSLKRNTHHGGTETRRKANPTPLKHGGNGGSGGRKRIARNAKSAKESKLKGKNIPPQMNADKRRSKKQLANGNWRLAEAKAHRRGAETRRKSSPLINTDGTAQTKGHAGVTNDKSFVSGVDREVPRRSGERKTTADKLQHGENALNRHGRDGHCRDLSTPPRVADAGSESLKMTSGENPRLNAEMGVGHGDEIASFCREE